jgi:LuxR family maltose regulon positive regulatory protein
VHAEAWDEAGALTVAHAPALLESGRSQTLSRWIDALPAPRQPWLDYWLGRAQAQTDPKQAAASFQRAETRFAHAGERTGRILSIAGLLQACYVDNRDHQTTDPWLDVLADELAALPSSLTAEQALIAWGALLFAAFFARPWHPCVLAGLDRVEALLGSVSSPAVAMAAATSALTVASQTSQMDRCERLASTVRALAAMPDMSPVLAAWGLFQVAHQSMLRAEYEDALARFDQIWSLAETAGLKKVLTATLTHRFMVEFRLRDLAAAEAAMRRVEALPAPQHPLSNGLLTCYRARLWQLRGQPQTAADLAQRSDTDIVATGAGFHLAIYGLINGEIMLDAGRVAQARPLIERARAVIERSAALSNLRASLALVEAWVAQQEAREPDCLGLLQQALTLSQVDYGWCQMRFVDTTATHMLPVALQRGIQPDAASRLIRLFRLRPPHPDVEGWPWPVRIRTFGGFEVRVDDRPLEFERKAPKKALALLKALVTLGPREVSDAKLVDALWPDEDGDAGQKALSVTLLRLRRLLGDNDLIHAQGGRMSLNRTRCWVDAWTFEDRLTAMPLAAEAGATGLPTLRRAVSCYGGSFLPDDAELPWTVPVRERLRSKFIHGLATLGTHLEDAASYDEAITWYLRGLDADAIVEPFYQGLMRCYDKLDRRTEAVAAYRRLRQTLSVTLGLQPAASSERLYRSLLTG